MHLWLITRLTISKRSLMPDTPDDFVGDGNEGMFEFEKQMRNS